MTLSELRRQIETRYPIALELEDWYGVPVFIQREPIYISVCETSKNTGKFMLVISKEEYYWPHIFDQKNLSAGEVIAQVGKQYAKQKGTKKERSKEQLSLFDMI